MAAAEKGMGKRGGGEGVSLPFSLPLDPPYLWTPVRRGKPETELSEQEGRPTTNLVKVLLSFSVPPTTSSSAHCINSVANPLHPPVNSLATFGGYKNKRSFSWLRALTNKNDKLFILFHFILLALP